MRFMARNEKCRPRAAPESGRKNRSTFVVTTKLRAGKRRCWEIATIHVAGQQHFGSIVTEGSQIMGNSLAMKLYSLRAWCSSAWWVATLVCTFTVVVFCYQQPQPRLLMATAAVQRSFFGWLAWGQPIVSCWLPEMRELA